VGALERSVRLSGTGRRREPSHNPKSTQSFNAAFAPTQRASTARVDAEGSRAVSHSEEEEDPRRASEPAGKQSAWILLALVFCLVALDVFLAAERFFA
jgi:hypothetical protein